VHTIEDAPATSGRRRRKHSAEFKAQAIAACKQPGISMAAVAQANGVNANLLRRWVIGEPSRVDDAALAPPRKGFIALSLPAPAASVSEASDIRVEVRRGSMTVNVVWPVQAAGDCATWLRELLR
jgi:transposase